MMGLALLAALGLMREVGEEELRENGYDPLPGKRYYANAAGEVWAEDASPALLPDGVPSEGGAQ